MMTNSQTILFLSNGYAEDTIASHIIEKLLQEYPFLKIKALPLVGEGTPYKKLNVEVLGAGTKMPSDGFVAGNLLYFFKDLKAGWLHTYRQKVKILRIQRSGTKLVVCVGDVFLVLTSALFLRKKPLVFLPTAKSDYIREHYSIEKWLMRLKCRLVITRDEVTALSLRGSGLNALHVGNLMMDCLKVTGKDFGTEKGHPVVGIVPGSKKEAYDNLKIILDAVREIYLQHQKEVHFLVALAPSLDVSLLTLSLPDRYHWKLHDATCEEKKKGILASLISPEKAVVKVIQGRFGDVVNLSRVIIGTAGMANEQVVGLGKPVVAFAGGGPQMTQRFLRIQQKLLGGTVFIVKKDAQAIARTVVSLLGDSEKLDEVERIGKQRMGEPGASPRVARLIYQELKNLH